MNSKDRSQLTTGQIIKAAREAKQISVNDVAQRLLLGKQVINAIEADDYSRIPAQVYAEGYLKAYAQFLQLPVAEVIASFRRSNVYANTEIKSDIKSQVECSNPCFSKMSNLLKDHKIRLILMLIFAALILGTLILFVVKLSTHKEVEVANISDDMGIINHEQPEVVVGDSAKEVTKSEKKDKHITPSEDEEQNSPSSTSLDVPLDINLPKDFIKRK